TLKHKTEKIGLKRTRNGILRIVEKWIKGRGKEQSASGRLIPRSSTVPPNDPECEDAKGKTLKVMSLPKCGLPSSWAISTNVAEQSSAAQYVKTINTRFVVENTKPPMCFRLAREGGHETKTTRLMA
ncbi:hypothetical protein H5410_027331, partial [Solanum commersonii]